MAKDASQRALVALTRLALGVLFFYAGITKVLNPEWSAAGYLAGAKNFTSLYTWLANPDILPTVNFLNEWGLTLIGVSLILGIAVRLSSAFGAILMILYYIPLGFPYPNAHAFIVDEHIVYALALLLLGNLRAGRVWGLENWCASLPICSRFPRLQNLLG